MNSNDGGGGNEPPDVDVDVMFGEKFPVAVFLLLGFSDAEPRSLTGGKASQCDTEPHSLRAIWHGSMDYFTLASSDFFS